MLMVSMRLTDKISAQMLVPQLTIRKMMREVPLTIKLLPSHPMRLKLLISHTHQRERSVLWMLV